MERDLMPFTEDQIALLFPLWETEDALFVHASNAISGSRLTLNETIFLFENGLASGRRAQEDYTDAVKGRKAHALMLDFARSHKPVNPRTMLALNRQILGQRSAAADLSLLGDLLAEYKKEIQRGSHPLVSSTILHFRIIKRRPFEAGNSKTARLVQNFSLIRDGYAPILIAPRDIERYVEYTRQSDYSFFLGHMAALFDRAMARYLAILESE